ISTKMSIGLLLDAERPMSPRVVELFSARSRHSFNQRFNRFGLVHLVGRPLLQSRATPSVYKSWSVVFLWNGCGSTGMTPKLTADAASAVVIQRTNTWLVAKSDGKSEAEGIEEELARPSVVSLAGVADWVYITVKMGS